MPAKKQAQAKVIDLPPAAPSANAYQSLRLKAMGHKLRYSHGPLVVEAERDQTITFCDAPYPHFKVMPGGLEFPLENIASAIPAAASLTQKLTRSGRVNARKAEAVRLLNERAKARAAAAEAEAAAEEEDSETDYDLSEGDDV